MLAALTHLNTQTRVHPYVYEKKDIYDQFIFNKEAANTSWGKG